MDQNIIVHEVPTGAEPEGVFISEDGKIVYVTSEVGDLVHMVDAEGGHVMQDVVVGTRPRRFAATPDGKELWVSGGAVGRGLHHRPRAASPCPARSSSCRPACARPTSRRSAWS